MKSTCLALRFSFKVFTKIAKSKYFAKVITYWKSPGSKLWIICSYFNSLKFFLDSHSGAIEEHFAKIAHKVAKSEYFFKYLKCIGVSDKFLFQ